jgi:hypothetical protein
MYKKLILMVSVSELLIFRIGEERSILFLEELCGVFLNLAYVFFFFKAKGV